MIPPRHRSNARATHSDHTVLSVAPRRSSGEHTISTLRSTLPPSMEKSQQTQRARDWIALVSTHCTRDHRCFSVPIILSTRCDLDETDARLDMAWALHDNRKPMDWCEQKRRRAWESGLILLSEKWQHTAIFFNTRGVPPIGFADAHINANTPIHSDLRESMRWRSLSNSEAIYDRHSAILIPHGRSLWNEH